MSSKAKEEIIRQLDSLKTVEKTSGFIILYKGEQLIMHSGKRIWSHRGYARSALLNCLHLYYEIRKEEGVNVGDVIKELEKEGVIEFKELK